MMSYSMPTHMWSYELEELEASWKGIPLVSALGLCILMGIGNYFSEFLPCLWSRRLSMSSISKFSVIQRRKHTNFPQCINLYHSENGRLL